MPALGGLHHLALSVTDLPTSEAWYSDIFGLQRRGGGENDAGRSAVMVNPDTGLTIGLRQDFANSGADFNEGRTGLDHVSIAVSSRAELDEWVAFLTERGAAFSPINDQEWGSLLVVRDPDNIPLELASPPAGS